MHNKALKDAEDALAKDPTCAMALVQKASVLFDVERVEEAKKFCAETKQKSTDVALNELLELVLMARTAQPKPKPKTSSAPPPKKVKTEPKMQTFTINPQELREGKSPAAAASWEQQVRNNPEMLKSLEVQVALGNMKTNNGQHREAIQHFSNILDKDPQVVGALVGRGTSFALIGELHRAEYDFSRALSVDPKMVDVYKRRSQVFGATGRPAEATHDLTEVLKLSPDDLEALSGRATLLHKFGEHKAAYEDISKAVRIKSHDKELWNTKGLVETSLGKSPDAIISFKKALQFDPEYKEAWANQGHAAREWGLAKQALNCFDKALKLDKNYTSAWHLRGFLHFGLGEYSKCIKDVTRTLELEPSHKDAAYLLALSHHNMGQTRKAIKAYDKFLSKHPDDPLWYNKENCLIMHHWLEKDVRTFNWDRAVNAYFREAWCKRSNPRRIKYNPQNGINADIPDIPIGKDVPPLSEEWKKIVELANTVGPRIQLDTPGFLPNIRQHRMCGLAVVEMAQTLRLHWQGKLPQLPGTFSSMNTEPHDFGWRDMLDIAVRWRQLSEANDTVWWIDLLPRPMFVEGFGLQTPMTTGQLHVPRYYPYFKKCFASMKKYIPQQHILTDEMAEKLEKAEDCADLWDLMKQDYFIISPCNKISPLQDGDPVPENSNREEAMEGTRITVMRELEKHGHHFSIRTPGTPERYKDYYVEMEILWHRLTVEGRKAEGERDFEKLSELILMFYFYWVNFQPLTRGSAACGLLVMMAMFMAAGSDLDSVVKKDMQTDWEGIVTPEYSVFAEIVKPWLFPRRVQKDVLAGVPLIAEHVHTVRQHMEILNHGLW
eukprot:TRINITY_DN49262_c0_g1_i1.p1 TRINITY_DN49262_c0_g1~~TRINITY_DN49262_c0_g1_i1.p1  ORF type:complete len:888 (+),score=100.99 TRINITY_DN49262_c0_g1_i1:171-2666(+)